MKAKINFIIFIALLLAICMGTASMYAEGSLVLKIEILSPIETTYSTDSVPLSFIVFEPICWIGYSLDDQMNVTITGNTTLTDLSDGMHSIVVYANDTAGNMMSSDTVHFTIDTTSPTIAIISPENKTYAVTGVPLDFNVAEPVSWIGYSLNAQANVTVTENVTLSGLVDGGHHVAVYANDTVGNMGSSAIVYFSVDTTPPDITNVVQAPPASNVLPTDEVRVNATVVDNLSGVKYVTLNYTTDNGAWIPVEMASLAGNVWEATIPRFPLDTNITYVIIAEDNVGNAIDTDTLGYTYKYPVIPEFPSIVTVLLFMAMTLLSIMFYKSKRLRTSTRLFSNKP